ncbi:MAG: purine-nucleoside phosphorylase [Sarcina sp.]|nr:purine-nucleoside phosphorylase [Sarcina sp.]
MSTPHNAANSGDIAQTVLLPGDPLRAKVISERFLKDAVQFNSVRNMYGFTGTYEGKRVSVMGTGMGMPSIGIYASELVKFYDVKNLIRIGSCGAITDKIKIGSIVMAQGACTDSNFAHQYDLPGTYSAIASYDLLSKAVESARSRKYDFEVGNIVSTDIFYNETEEWKKWAKMGCLANEMESYALYCIAARAGVNALALFTVSDSLVTGEATSAAERENNFTGMMQIALDVAASL